MIDANDDSSFLVTTAVVVSESVSSQYTSWVSSIRDLINAMWTYCESKSAGVEHIVVVDF
jgi:predicted lipoprotein